MNNVVGIYPKDWADLCIKRAGQPYQPSNGTEGECFHSSWCCQCARDKAMSEGKPIEECDDNEKCSSLGRSCYKLTDPDYPKEWQYGKDGQPCCTAFIEAGQPIPAPRDENTADMFAGGGDE